MNSTTTSQNPYESPNARGAELASHNPNGVISALAISFVIGIGVSFPLVLWSAAAEPFYGPFRLDDALVSIIGGGLIISFWPLWSLALIYAVMRRWLPKAFLLLLLLTIVFEFYSSFVLLGYIGDRQDWNRRRHSLNFQKQTNCCRTNG